MLVNSFKDICQKKQFCKQVPLKLKHINLACSTAGMWNFPKTRKFQSKSINVNTRRTKPLAYQIYAQEVENLPGVRILEDLTQGVFHVYQYRLRGPLQSFFCKAVHRLTFQRVANKTGPVCLTIGIGQYFGGWNKDNFVLMLSCVVFDLFAWWSHEN